MFLLYNYHILDNNSLPQCEEYGKQLELKEVVLYDRDATEMAPPDHCLVCSE